MEWQTDKPKIFVFHNHEANANAGKIVQAILAKAFRRDL